MKTYLLIHKLIQMLQDKISSDFRNASPKIQHNYTILVFFLGTVSVATINMDKNVTLSTKIQFYILFFTFPRLNNARLSARKCRGKTSVVYRSING